MEKPNTLLWAYVDLPPVPDRWIKDALTTAQNEQLRDRSSDPPPIGDTRHLNRTLIKDNAEVKSGSHNKAICFGAEQDAYTWVLDHVSPHAKMFSLMFTLPAFDSVGPHIDGKRDYVLMYVLQGGGPDHETVFWREKGVEELVRPLKHLVNDYGQLERVNGIKIPDRTWVLLNARVLHSTENISQGRISLQVSFDDIETLKLLETVYAS